jgi:tetratricopeptide (TPR) repeat protein
MKRAIVSALYLTLLGGIAICAYKFGFSQILAEDGRRNGSPSSFHRARAIDDANASPFEFRGEQNLRNQEFESAVESFREAVLRRPNDYLLWIRLGYSLDKIGDREGARVSFGRAVALAPNYSISNRHYGRHILNEGKVDEAFAFLRRAAANDENTIPDLLHLARMQAPEDGTEVERLVGSDTPELKRRLAAYLIKHGMLTPTIKDFILTGLETEEQKEYFAERLLRYGNSALARQVWMTSLAASRSPLAAGEYLFDGGFETSPSKSTKGFNWKSASSDDSIVGIDHGTFRSGNSSLRVVLKGDVPLETDLVSQIVPTDKDRNFSLEFYVLSSTITSYGGIYLTVTDHTTGARLATSEAFADTTGNWKKYGLAFKSTSDAVRVAIRRTPCRSSPCPIFADVRIDDASCRLR